MKINKLVANKKIISKTTIEVVYSILSVLLPSLFFLISYFLLNINFWIKLPSIIILDLITTSLLFYFAQEILEYIVPKKYQDEKGFFYNPRWKSWEFDNFIGEELLDLYEDSVKIFEDYNKEIEKSLHNMSDYSFLVLPMAKVYEGILKRVLVKTKILKEEDLLSNPTINVGGYFNPIGNHKIFDRLKDKARDKTVPHIIYSTYQECRNNILHYDSYKDNRIKNIKDAEFYARRIMHAIDKVYESFK